MQELDDEELLLELPLLRLGTEGAAAIEDFVRSTVGAPGKLPKGTNAKASSNSAKTKPNPSTGFAKYYRKNFLNVEGKGWCLIIHP